MTYETSNPSTQANAGPGRPAEARTPHILVAEDDDDMRALLGQALRCSGYEVAELSDGLHLVACIASAEPGRFDAIVSDIRMPRHTGLEILNGMRSANLTVPVTLAKSVSSFPRPTFWPGWIRVPRWRTMIDPAVMNSPEKRLTPRR